MSPTVKDASVFGVTANGDQVKSFTLTNDNNVKVQIISFGGIITSISVPDKTGVFEDITTGFETMEEYEKNPAFFGAIIGRVANRIYEGKFQLEDREYCLAQNRPPNHLHGGMVGFDKKVWQAVMEGSKLKLAYTSCDGEESYPGNLTVQVTYELNNDNELCIEYKATTDKTTIVNLTNHAYFNLAGHKAPTIGDQLLTVHADKYLEKTSAGVPSGKILSVKDTVFDLENPVLLSDRLMKISGDKPGYDHNFCLSSPGDKSLAARLDHPASGRSLEVYTTQPGLQVYTGNFLSGISGKQGACYEQHSAIALETQNYPDAINHENFPSCVLKAGEEYLQKTWYKFITN